MAGHTPGPWVARPAKSSDDNRVVYCLIGPAAALDKGYGVAYAGTYGKTRHMKTAGIRQSDEECEANARLISAAPELLAVCQAALGTDDAELRDIAREAIAKATGQ